MKKNIAVIMGGNSSEYEVSIKSGENIANNLDRTKYNIYKVLVKGKDWRVIDNEINGAIIDKNDFSFTFQDTKTVFDLAFIAIHGNPGEDGHLQAYFELIGLPYTSSKMFSSALTFDKFTCNRFLRSFGIITAKSVLLREISNIDTAAILGITGLPCFVKPNNSGSSCGVSKVKSEDELATAVRKAFAEDSSGVIIEEFIEGTEVTCGVLKTKEKEIVFPIVEIVSKKEFFDYEAKYNPELSEEILPARISPEQEIKCKEISLKIYKLLGCTGLVRIDYIIKYNSFYFLEINTVPGQTSESILPKMIKAFGLELKDVYEMIVEDTI